MFQILLRSRGVVFECRLVDKKLFGFNNLSPDRGPLTISVDTKIDFIILTLKAHILKI